MGMDSIPTEFRNNHKKKHVSREINSRLNGKNLLLELRAP
jgi:hypothetical protein